MLHEPLTDDGSLAGQDGEHVLGKAGAQRQLAQPDSGQRSQLGGFQHDGVPGRQGWRESPAGDRHREVPRHDHSHHAERLVERHVKPAGDRDLLADQPLRSGGVVVQHVADVARLPARVADRVAGVRDLQLRQMLEVGADFLGEPAQQPGTVRRSDRPPCRGRAGRPGDRRVGLLGICQLDRLDDLLGRRVDHVVCRHCRSDRSRAALTSASNSLRSSGFSSGCHCTPSTQSAPASSTASTSPSFAHAVATSGLGIAPSP